MVEMVYAPKAHVSRLISPGPIKLFFAGSIDNGAAIDWQSKLYKDIIDSHMETESSISRDIICFNPRRPDWGEMDCEKMSEQINWELDHIYSSDLVVVYFADDSKAPITFLELGTLLAQVGGPDVIIYCSDKFYRSDNVNITSYRFGTKVHKSYDSFLAAINNWIAVENLTIINRS